MEAQQLESTLQRTMTVISEAHRFYSADHKEVDSVKFWEWMRGAYSSIHIEEVLAQGSAVGTSLGMKRYQNLVEMLHQKCIHPDWKYRLTKELKGGVDFTAADEGWSVNMHYIPHYSSLLDTIDVGWFRRRPDKIFVNHIQDDEEFHICLCRGDVEVKRFSIPGHRVRDMLDGVAPIILNNNT